MSSEEIVTKVKRIIYVDASFDKASNESKIALYDKKKKKLYTLLSRAPKSSSEAERYAILNAFLYVKYRGIEHQKIHILNDNFTVVNHTTIDIISKYLGISVSWIPREINKKADKGTKKESEINVKEKYTNLLEFFYELIFEQNIIQEKKIIIKKSETIIENIELEQNIIKNKNILKNAIRHSKIENQPYVSIGEVGKYLKENNPTFEYTQLKKEILKYPNEFDIIDNNNVKIKI